MTGAARKSSRAPETDQDDEITIESRVRITPEMGFEAGPITTRMTKIDERLLAIARGDLDPDDPFGGLIPIYEDERDEVEEVDAEWLVLTTPEPRTGSSLFGNIVPRVRMRPDELFSLPLDERCSLFVSQADGRRTLEEVIDACGLDELEGLETIDDLLRFGAIVLG